MFKHLFWDTEWEVLKGTRTFLLKHLVCITGALAGNCSKALTVVILINSSFAMACFYAETRFHYHSGNVLRKCRELGSAEKSGNPYRVYPELAGGHRCCCLFSIYIYIIIIFIFFFPEEKIPPCRKKDIHTRSWVETHTIQCAWKEIACRNWSSQS